MMTISGNVYIGSDDKYLDFLIIYFFVKFIPHSFVLGMIKNHQKAALNLRYQGNEDELYKLVIFCSYSDCLYLNECALFKIIRIKFLLRK